MKDASVTVKYMLLCRLLAKWYFYWALYFRLLKYTRPNNCTEKPFSCFPKFLCDTCSVFCYPMCLVTPNSGPIKINSLWSDAIFHSSFFYGNWSKQHHKFFTALDFFTHKPYDYESLKARITFLLLPPNSQTFFVQISIFDTSKQAKV